MPVYTYRFQDGAEIEVYQTIYEDSCTKLAHPDTGEILPVKKVIASPSVHFKGSGFYKNDKNK